MHAIPFGDVPAHFADSKPTAPALVYAGQTVTWDRLRILAMRAARKLRGRGVAVDDIVTLAMPNGVAFHAYSFAAWSLGATVNPVPPRLPERELSELIDLAGSKVVVAASPTLAKLPRGMTPILEADGEDERTAPPSCVATHWKAMPSGGSTGRPKLIVDHGSAVCGPEIHVAAQLLRLPPQAVILNPGPLYHNAPFVATSLTLFTGGTVVGMERFDAEEALRLIEAHRVQWVMLVPAMMHRIWALPAKVRERYDLSSLQCVWHTAAPCPPWLKEAWVDWLGPERIWEMYGGTEATGVAVINGEEWRRKPGSVGRMLGAVVKAVRPDGVDCAPGEIGELYSLRGDGSAAPSHYRGAQQRTLPGGFISIGDLGHVDEEGFLFIADRRTDLIIRGGANIFPAEIEGQLEAFDGVEGCVVIGLPSEDMGQRVHAILQVQDAAGFDLSALHAFLATRLSKYKLPESYEFTGGPLRDEAGKVRRSALRDERIELVRQGAPFRRLVEEAR